MFEMIVGFFASVWVIGIALFIGLLACSEMVEKGDIRTYKSYINGGAATVTAICMIICMSGFIALFGQDIQGLVGGFNKFVAVFGVYLAIGVVFSFFEYKKFLTESLKTIRTYTTCRTLEDKNAAINNLSPENSKGVIAMFVLVWPIRFLSNFVHDFTDVWQFIGGWAYKKIFDNAMKNVN